MRAFPIYEMAGAGLGAALGWLLAPPGDQRLGLGIGGGIGALLGSAWKWWWLRRRPLMEGSPGLRRGGHTIYALAIGLCLLALWFPLKTWVQYPEKWLAAVAGLLFFGAGAVVLILLWQADRRPVSAQASDARWAIACGIAYFALASSGILVVVLGNPVIGILGIAFFGLCGVMAIRRGRSMGNR